MLMIFRLFLLFMIEISFLTLPNGEREGGIAYFQPSTLPFEIESQQTHELDFEDSVSGETVYQVNDADDRPLYYYSNIRTGVCFDNECRPLDIMIYWNITGRYLGFTLPEEEFLSKYDHEPFTHEEYERLNMLLADSLLPLGNVSFEELVQTSATQNIENIEVDGVSGATSQEVLDFVVEGAAYTTHKLWNIIYGSSQDLVEKLTEKKLSSELIGAILKSPDLGDKFWALNHLQSVKELTPALESELLNCIDDENYSLAATALSVIDSTMLFEAMQMQLLEKFENCNYSLKLLILDKLKNVSALSQPFIESSSQQLQTLNGKVLDEMLALYKMHHLTDEEAIKKIAELLNDENRFVSQKAYLFLKDIEVKDAAILMQIKDYSAN